MAELKTFIVMRIKTEEKILAFATAAPLPQKITHSAAIRLARPAA
jgi:hypothetical protein